MYICAHNADLQLELEHGVMIKVSVINKHEVMVTRATQAEKRCQGYSTVVNLLTCTASQVVIY